MRRIASTLLGLLLPFLLSAEPFRSFSGRVQARDGSAVEAAVVLLPASGQWAVTDAKGNFRISNVRQGELDVKVSCLGYADALLHFKANQDIRQVSITLEEDNLALEQVVVTAEENASGSTTTRKIDRKALDHLQMLDVTDISSLLPGGKTISPDLSSPTDNKFAVRGSSFGTAVEIDGVRLSNNASPTETDGAGTRNIASSDIESVEVIAGVPSVEYGDLTGGVVRIRTKEGKSPWKVTLMANPRTKQIALSKGFATDGAGIFNVSAERTRSVRNLASPYTSYSRNNVSLKWSDTFNKGNSPVRVSATLSGNIGGMDSHADPDANSDSYTRSRDNAFRFQVSADWLADLRWLTSLELSASVSYADKLSETNTLRSSAASPIALHGMEEGYFVAQDVRTSPDAPVLLLQPGYWYERSFTDSKPLDYNIHLKAGWNRQFGRVGSHLKLGLHLDGTRNFGRGLTYESLEKAPSWRPWPYSSLPAMHNLAAFVEEAVNIPIGRTRLNLTGGLRWDNTLLKGSRYPNVSSLSPRANLKYTFIEKGKTVRHLSLRASYGLAYKLPSFHILYPTPQYSDVLSFTPGTLADGTLWQAWYIRPHSMRYNPSLRWQRARQSEVGLELELPWFKLSLSGWYNRQEDSYTLRSQYSPYSFKFTSQKDLASVGIPAENRIYAIDRKSGVVSVSDRNGVLPSEEVSYKVRNTFLATTQPENASPTHRAGIEWVLDFGQIRAIRTGIRIDGRYNWSKTLEEGMIASYPGTLLSDGSPYPYLGYYVGGASASNGTLNENVDLNLTVTTHIPKIRMILTLKLESGLYRCRRSLSESAQGQRSWAVGDKASYAPESPDIYDRNLYTVTYPAWYVSVDDPSTRIDFYEKFLWAKANDPQLYKDLQWLVVRSNYGYTMNTARISPYFSVNFSVTKEIGKIASISFYANNFIQNMGKVVSSQNGNEISLFGSGYIPEFYYGLTLRLKF